MLGAGGSILLLPLLVSGAALPTKVAVPLTAGRHPAGPRQCRSLHPPPAGRGPTCPGAGLPALAGSWIGGSLVKAGLIPEAMQLGYFAAAALLASWLLLRPSARAQPPRRQKLSRLAHGSGRPGRAGGPAHRASPGSAVALRSCRPLCCWLACRSNSASGTSLAADQPSTLWWLLPPWATGPAAHLPLMLPLIGGGVHWRDRRPATRASPARTAAAPGFLSPADRLGPAHRLRGLGRHHRPLAALRAASQSPGRSLSIGVSLRPSPSPQCRPTMSERTFQFRLRSSHPAPDRATQDLVVEFWATPADGNPSSSASPCRASASI